jgi:S-adenosylmethionine uptake transporter
LSLALTTSGICSAVFAALMLPAFSMPTPAELALLLPLGVMGGPATVLLNLAYQNAPAPVLAAIDYLSVPSSMVAGVFLWHDIPAPMAVGGASLMAAASLCSVHHRSIAVGTPPSASGH